MGVLCLRAGSEEEGEVPLLGTPQVMSDTMWGPRRHRPRAQTVALSSRSSALQGHHRQMAVTLVVSAPPLSLWLSSCSPSSGGARNRTAGAEEMGKDRELADPAPCLR